MNTDKLAVFALNSSRNFGEKVVAAMDVELSEHEEREFGDGEHKSRSLVNVRDKEVFVIQSLYAEPGKSVNDKLCRLLFFIGSLKDAAAKKVTLIAPYLCYARKDRKTKFRDPVTTRYLAKIIEAVGTDRILTIDVHNLQAYQNAYRCQSEHLEAKNVFAHYFSAIVADEEVVILSPDFGGIKRAEQFGQSLGEAFDKDIPLAVMDKQRSMGVVSGSTDIYGKVEGKTVIIIDDLISSGTTLSRAANACRVMGAHKVYAAATHGAFTEKANAVLRESALDKIIVTNTIRPFRLEEDILQGKVEILDVAPLFAEAIHRIWQSGSLTELLKFDLPTAIFENKN